MIITEKHQGSYGSIARLTNDNMTDSESFKSKLGLKNNDNNAGTTNVEIAVPLKYLGNFWWALKIPLINCERKFLQ